ncbi:MAG: ATP-binding cassette domain-containing protein [Bacteroidaceae bacterium]
MSIKLSNIYKSYGKQEVLHDVSFEVHPGEITSFVGINGAGKSTCIKIITGGIVADAGEVNIDGHNIEQDAIAAKRCMGYLPEDNPLYPEMFVKEYLAYVAQLYRLPNVNEAVDEVIEKVKLQEIAYKKIAALSKGFRQRVGLAQAIVHQPQNIILDEPSSGLDPNQLTEFHHLIKELGKGKTILFSSHSLQEVSDLCARVIIVHRGKIVKDDSLSALTKEKSLDEMFKELTT